MTSLKPEAEARCKALRDRLDQVAPRPEAHADGPGTAVMLIRSIAADLTIADARFRLSARRDQLPDVSLVPLMSSLFAAGHALVRAGKNPDETAGEIVAGCEYGETGDYAAEWLGADYAEVLAIADELAVLDAAAAGRIR